MGKTELSIILFISFIVIIWSIGRAGKETNYKKKILEILNNIPGLKFEHIVFQRSFATTLALDFQNRKICFISNTLEPHIYDFSQIESVDTVNRVTLKDYSQPRYTDYDPTIELEYHHKYFGIDLDIVINTSKKTIYSIPFLGSIGRVKYADLSYRIANRSRLDLQSLIKEHLEPKGFKIKIPMDSDLPIPSLSDELRKLKDLFDEGALTKEEFEQQKARLLK